MVDLLVEHARSTVWSDATRDDQYMIACRRITQSGGALKFFSHARRNFNLPDIPGVFFHVFSIGAYNEQTFDLDLDTQGWVNFQTLALDQKAVVELVLDNGCIVPRNLCWIKLTLNRNIFVAVENRTIDLGKVRVLDPITAEFSLINNRLDIGNAMLRTYSNRLYRTTEWNSTVGAAYPVQVFTRLITGVNDFNSLVQDENTLLSQFPSNPLSSVWFKDGFAISKPVAYDNSLNGSHVGFVWDLSITAKKLYKVSDCPAFESILDPFSRKLAIIPTDGDHNLFHDDCDVYLVGGNDPSNFKGVRLPYHRKGTVKQLTNNGFSVRADVAESLQISHPGLDYFMVVERDGGYFHEAINASNRLMELYLLPYSEILKAVAGVNANIPEWKASGLENSDFTKLMAASFDSITNTLATNAYGFGLIQNVFAEPNQTVSNGIVSTPLICQKAIPGTSGTKRCVFGYENGMLTGFQNDTSIIPSIGLNTPLDTSTHAEVFQGLVDSTDDVIYDQLTITNPDLEHFGFRCYVCSIVSGSPIWDWEDVTDSFYYQYDPDTYTLTWNSTILGTQFLPAVKIGNTVQMFVKDDFTTSSYDGNLRFTVGDGVHGQIPPGLINVFLNGRSLVQDIDFVVRWPQICVNRVPADQPIENLIIEVRTMGWCNPQTMKPWLVESGWVKDGKISVDGHRSVRTQRSGFVVSNEKYLSMNQVNYAELNNGPLITDGKPYAIYDYVCPVDALTDQSTVDLIVREKDFGSRVSDYLTAKIGEPAPTNPVIIGSRYQLFSPIVSTLIHSLLAGYLGNGELDGQYTNLDVDVWLEPFKDLLEFDPAYLKIDDQYVDVRAHQYSVTVELTNSQYRFVEYVIKHYLFDRIDLTPTVLNLG